MVVEMLAPRSYTGDDVVELHVHGSPVVVARVMETCCHWGARPARPGEFTFRAFLNGKMDLAQAEAVGDLIAAGDDALHRVATRQLQGALSQRILDILDTLERILSQWRAALDFPEHPTGEGRLDAHHMEIAEVNCKIQELIAGAQLKLREGFQVVVCGAPNVGKSTLINAWAGQSRVLVDDSPGTTRDPVEVRLTDQGQTWSVWDTAGFRREGARLEMAGMAMARHRIDEADAVVWLMDANAPLWPDDAVTDHVRWVVGAKSDGVDLEQRRVFENTVQEQNLPFWGWISGVRGEGLEELRSDLVASTWDPNSENTVVVTRRRHYDALTKASNALERIQSHHLQTTLDALSRDLEEAVQILGAIVGRDVDGAVLDRIFSEFCIGK